MLITTSRNANKQMVLFAKKFAKEFSHSAYFPRGRHKSLDKLIAKARYEGLKWILIVNKAGGKLRANVVRVEEKDWRHQFSIELSKKKLKEQIATIKRKIK